MRYRPEFWTPIYTHVIDDSVSEIIANVRYWSARQQREIVVPGREDGRPGYHYDGASVPRLLFVYWITGGRARKAALIHDFLYDPRREDDPDEPMPERVKRPVADGEFYDAMRATSVSPPIAWLMWAGVRIGGWWPYYFGWWVKPRFRAWLGA